MTSGPSDKAVKAARDGAPVQQSLSRTRRMLEAAHDPALGLDRSVCLRDVVNALRGETSARPPGTYPAQSNWNNMTSYADFIERVFGDA